MELLENFTLLKINELSNVWVDTIWELDFTETEPLDPLLEAQITEGGLEVFRNIYNGLLPFSTDNVASTESIWTLFTKNNIQSNALVALLYHFVQLVQKSSCSVEQRQYAMNAAGLYFLLLEVPGSVANRIFHPIMFDKCLDTLKKSWPQENVSRGKRKKDTVKSSQNKIKGRKRTKPRQEEMEIEEESEDEDQQGNVCFSPNDLLKIREEIFLLLKTFLRLLSKLSLKDKPQCIQHCLQILIEVTHYEPVISQLAFFADPDVNKMKALPELCYHGLRVLCSSMHGEGDRTVRRVFHQMLYVILMMSGGDGGSPSLLAITQNVVSAREQAVKFVSHMAKEMKENIIPVMRILLQHICTKVADKAEYRTYAAQALAKLLCELPSANYASFIEWLYNFSHNTKSQYRVFALDASMALLEHPELEMNETVDPEHARFLQHKFLIEEIIFRRCSDKAPVVRSRALTCFAQCLEHIASVSVEGFQDVFQKSSAKSMTDGAFSTIFPENSEASSTAAHQQQKSMGVFKSVELTKRTEAHIFDAMEVMDILRVRARDEKVNVRKSALQVLTNILKFGIVSCCPEDLSILQDRCRDPAVSVRKQALLCLTDLLLTHSTNSVVQKAWLSGVVPVVLDSETSVQEKALECLEQLVLQHIRNYSIQFENDPHQKLAWDLLSLLSGENQDLCRYLSKAFAIWSKKERFSSSFINSLISHTETDHSSAAWMLLAKVAGSAPKLNYGKILEAWDDIVSEKEVLSSTTCHILCVIGHIAKHLNDDTKSRLIDDIKKCILSFRAPLVVISAAVDSLHRLGKSESSEETQTFLNDHCGEIISVCSSYLSSIILCEDGVEHIDEDLVVSHLFTLGEAALLCPAKVDKRIFLLVQSILASNVNLDADASVDTEEGIPASQPLSQFKTSSMPTTVRAHAFITLGKLCLQHEELAKKCIPALARELEVCEEIPIRNNVIIVMCDLCVRYTSMVDRYIPNVSVNLKDNDPFIRKQTLIMLTNLLQEEFVKWKGSLFFRFVSVLVDPDPSIASLGEFCLVHLLLKRNPIMFSQHFIECIFHFNNYEKHDKYNKFKQTQREKTMFSLQGAKNKERRMKIYKFLLEHFTDEQRFSITSKICHNVLACFVDGLLPLDSEGGDLLSDTFEVLGLKEIKLSVMRSKPGEDGQGDEDEMAMANAVMEVAQKKLISHVQKKNFIENVIPIIIVLKGMLEEKRIPALRDLMSYLREMMQDYRNEIQDFFTADKQLAAELEYDMKKYEEQLEKEGQQEEENVTSAPQPDTDATADTAAALPKTPPLPVQDSPAVLVPRDVCITPDSRCLLQQLENKSPHTLPRVLPQPLRVTALLSRARPKSLSTDAILNSARKMTESIKKQRSQSISAGGHIPYKENPDANEAGSLQDQSSSSQSSVHMRAISTPESTINNVTFGVGVSYICNSKSFSSVHGDGQSSGKSKKDILCLQSPDKPSPRPQQWNIESPLPQRQLTRSTRKKTPLRPTN
ncbi:condensin-2 complex subunit D3 [Erpetoichthys calabaricus]|uniref:Condensin-2 complex subunit D3 n=1 Tax=Erpetoichthys calabaricus TaxID=27687 RepID=A0A8C4TJZ5_ERPCA|nr:condensin-2 complex subunit D3 [Erpetoichthys calabaricus]